MKTVGLSIICAGLAFLMLRLSPSCINIGMGSYTGDQYSIKHNRYGCDYSFLKNPSI